MNKGNKGKKGNKGGQKVSQRDSVPSPASVQSWVAIRPSGWQRFKDFLKKTFKPSPKLILLNDISHLGENQENKEPTDPLASLLKLEERVDRMAESIQK